ncbi:MAG: hypothetical protein LAO06_19660, partial [Acidobacteriia bacterium]|nr:hypothetical protein [Terriglobia bacterium]
MKKTFVLAVLLMVAGLAFGQVVVNDVKVCNSFAADGVTPIFSAAGFPNTTGTTACTDIFGVPNYANSPLPVRSCSVATTTTCFGDADCGLTGGVCTGVITSGGMHKFVDTLASPLAGLTLGSPTNIAATATVPASDYYEIALVQNTVQMHSELPATTVRGYVQVGPGSVGCPATPPPIHYLGPVILAQKNKPVRIKFINCLPSALAAGNPGNLIIPTDNTYMGAGDSPDPTKPYLENRATLHLHGGATPWISDGTPHQWTVPAADWRASTPSPTGPGDNVNRGLSTQFVPDMWFNSSGQFLQTCTGQTGTCQQFPTATNDPGHGAMTFYYTNQQGGRLMFYHDHAYGITRLNV